MFFVYIYIFPIFIINIKMDENDNEQGKDPARDILVPKGCEVVVCRGCGEAVVAQPDSLCYKEQLCHDCLASLEQKRQDEALMKMYAQEDKQGKEPVQSKEFLAVGQNYILCDGESVRRDPSFFRMSKIGVYTGENSPGQIECAHCDHARLYPRVGKTYDFRKFSEAHVCGKRECKDDPAVPLPHNVAGKKIKVVKIRKGDIYGHGSISFVVI